MPGTSEPTPTSSLIPSSELSIPEVDTLVVPPGPPSGPPSMEEGPVVSSLSSTHALVMHDSPGSQPPPTVHGQPALPVGQSSPVSPHEAPIPTAPTNPPSNQAQRIEAIVRHARRCLEENAARYRSKRTWKWLRWPFQ